MVFLHMPQLPETINVSVFCRVVAAGAADFWLQAERLNMSPNKNNANFMMDMIDE